ncbi:neutral zinc metallopeptidase [Saccharopolyspora mangrovi]|uniref:Peptidase n=1 Tax=Saccharopolyspora mangrovi TaxID=3082379 RepID=A0ABU6AA53_9PSEU|nr:peptidase [Saccharopolyspora sp. S2-29]MEB3368342.1 peptidase [Saccharopolyspora sp. S2-29]
MRAFGLVAATVGLIISACTTPAAPPDVAEPTVDPAFVHGTDRGGTDRLAATVVTDVQAYWAQAYPAAFGGPWRDLDGGFFSVDTGNATGTAPPCASSPQEVEGNAYYCQSVDAIAWDRAALLPVLREHYGDTAVAVVLAHEIGHAVQQRAGLAEGEPLRLESMADCYAGSFLRWVSDGHAPHLRTTPDRLDDGLRAITVFRDPVGTSGHGTAFDRVTAFQHGFTGGPRGCTQVSESHVAEPVDDDRNAPLTSVLDTTAIDDYFRTAVTEQGGRWVPPSRSTGCPGASGPVGYCPAPPTVTADPAALARTHDDIGDQAVTTLLASRYALAALTELGHRPTGSAITCLTGSFTADQPNLSPGDLDEAVQVVLESDAVSRGGEPMSGSDRIAAFRDGLRSGAGGCLS